MKKLMVFAVICALLLTGCNVLQPPVDPTGPGQTPTDPTDPSNAPNIPDTPNTNVDFEQNDDFLFSDNDQDTSYSENDSAVISLNGTAITSNAPTVIISGSTATITKEGNYIIRGQLTDGSVVINASEKAKIQLILEGTSITSANSAALQILSAKKVVLTLAEGTENTLANGGSFAEDALGVDGALFSKTDLTINGEGSLNVTSPAGHGIVCKDDLAITGGNITVHSASHGLDANDSVRINGGTISIDSGKDGVHVEDAEKTDVGFVYVSGGTIKIESEGDGLSAALHMQISGGTIDILAGGGYENGQQHSSGGWGDFMGGGMGPGQRPTKPRATTTTTEDVTSMKGLKAGDGLLMDGGSVTINSADDAIHSNDMTVISGGTLQIASGDDGIHADTNLSISDGTISITKSYEGLEAQHVVISGGEISLVSTDDGINAAGGVDGSGEGGRDQMTRAGFGASANSTGSVTISGGKLYIQASGDGIDANGTLKITGGYTVVCGPNSGDTATLDYDVSGIITGGVFIGTGSSMMAQSFSTGSQATLATNAGSQAAGSTITVTDSQGNVLLTYQPELAFSVFIYSAPELAAGQSYHLVVGTAEGDMTAK